MDNIFATVRQEIRDFMFNDIRIVEGYSFNQYNTIKRIHLYDASQFEDDSLYNGREKIFFNISNPRRDAVARFLDVDVKDVRIDEINPQSDTYLKLLNHAYLRYAERNNLSKQYNKLAHQLATYGSVVLKDNAGDSEIIDLRNLFLDPTVETITDSRFITIKHVMTPTELRSKVADGWDKDAIERIIARGGRSNSPESYEDDRGGLNMVMSSQLIEVYERYGYVPENLLKGGKSEDEVMSIFIIAEPFMYNEEGDSKGNISREEKGEILFKSEWRKDLPFDDEHFVKIPGRWMGLGVFEGLFPAQERINEVFNQKRVSMELSTMHLFQTSDKTVVNNILSDLENGDVLVTKTPNALQPIVNEERNLKAFQSEELSWTQLADKISFANDLLAGGDIPSSTPATNVVVQNNNQVLVHLQKRENFANFIGRYTKKFVYPQLIKELKGEQYLKVMGDPEDLLFIDDAIVKVRMRNEVIRRAIEEGSVIDAVQGEELEREIRQDLQKMGGKRYIKIMQDYFKNNEKDIIVHVDNEKKDIARIANNTFQFFSTIAPNPQVWDDPVNRTLLTTYAREIGVDMDRLEVAFAKREASKQQQAQTQVPENNARTQTDAEQELAQVL